jgi:hypothetical protein
LILNYNKVYLAASLIAKPNKDPFKTKGQLNSE